MLGSARFKETFGVFSNANFRWYWTGSFCYYTGFWMEMLVRAWLSYELTQSATALGVVQASQGFPMAVLSVVGGTLADRIPKQRLLLTAQVVLAASAAILFALLVADVLEYWELGC